MKTDFVTIQSGKWKGKAIYPPSPPSPKEILNDDFDYAEYFNKYISEYFEKPLSGEEIEDLIYSEKKPSGKPLTEEERQIYDVFASQIIALQRQYEEEQKTQNFTIDYNQAMKEIAQQYFDNLKSHTTFKLERENKLHQIQGDRQDLINVLKKIAQKKRSIEMGAEARLQAFVSGEIPIEKLCLFDLLYLTKTEVYHQNRRLLEKSVAHVFSNLSIDKNDYHKPIEELGFRRKSK